jgi:hypothetical protein
MRKANDSENLMGILGVNPIYFDFDSINIRKFDYNS